MSVLIKGMEMPEDGAYFCEVGVIEGVGTITFHTEERQVFRLAEVPPHGRLIAADALADNWYYASAALRSDDVKKVVCLDDIDNAPTIIEAEE